jgi:16S rRNA pseudouridine516 synthase
VTSYRLDRLLANLGYGSRKEITKMVAEGRVLLNGIIVKKSDTSVTVADARNGLLLVDDEPVDPPSPLTVMLHKPAGFICSRDEDGDLVYDLLPFRWAFRKPVLSCAGRLDKHSTGQVLLTDDGELLHRIIHPKNHAPKYYAVTLAKKLRGDEAALFSSGGFLMDGDAKPLKAATWIPDGDTGGKMILQEGRYHQIRRMFETLGNEVLSLHRYQTGGLELSPLAEGQYKILDDSEIQKIFVN